MGRDNHARVSRLNTSLQSRHITTWFDTDKMSGNIRDKMAEGISNTQTVIVCITERYLLKVNGLDARDNCKFELDYAFMHLGSRKLIPVVMEPRMKNTGNWQSGVGKAMLSGILYVDMSSDDDAIFEAAVDVLAECVKLAATY